VHYKSHPSPIDSGTVAGDGVVESPIGGRDEAHSLTNGSNVDPRGQSIRDSLPSRNAKASSRIEALHRSRITFLSREIHSSTCAHRQTIAAQIPAMMLALFSHDWKVT
jgi:hypothetical protein